MGHEVSLHTAEVQDEEDGALPLNQLMVRLVDSSLAGDGAQLPQAEL